MGLVLILTTEIFAPWQAQKLSWKCVAENRGILCTPEDPPIFELNKAWMKQVRYGYGNVNRL